MVLLLALWMPIWIGFLTLSGCQSGTTGLLRPISDSAYTTATNSVNTVTTTANQIIPPPWNTAVEAGGAAVLALLAAWQGLTHSKLKTLTDTQPPDLPKGTA